jgi:undecaprenyl-diphosphatase
VALIQILVLSVIRGLTEFLPVSSSGHTLVTRILTGWRDHGVALDLAMHLGALVAVLIYFWRDVWRMIAGLARLATGRRDPGARLAGYLILGTIPALIVGWFGAHYAGGVLHRIDVVAWTMIAFAAVLWFADRYGLTILRLEHLRASHALIVGICQCLAFIPGASRAVTGILAGRLLGFERAEAARFSFLLAIPWFAAVALWEGYNLYRAETPIAVPDAAIAAGATAIAGLIAIAALIAWLRRRSFAPFVAYRLLLGAALLALIYLQTPLR